MIFLLNWTLKLNPTTPGINVVFARGKEYRETYLLRILNHPEVKAKFRSFMELKRNDPYASFSTHDKPYRPGGEFTSKVPGIRHAHIMHDLILTYKMERRGNNVIIYLYGFHTHAKLGIDRSQNLNVQKGMASKFQSEVFTESADSDWTRLKKLVSRLLGR